MNVYGFWNARKKSISDKQIGGSFIIVRSIDEHNNHFTNITVLERQILEY